MERIGNIKILFVAGFGPIVRDADASHELYCESLGIPFKEESGGYLHTEGLDGAKSFALWPLSQAAQSCFGKEVRPDVIPVPQAWLEFDVESVEKATAELESRGYRMLVSPGQNLGGRRSLVSSHRKGCCSVSLSLRRCEKKTSINLIQKVALLIAGSVRAVVLPGENLLAAEPDGRTSAYVLQRVRTPRYAPCEAQGRRLRAPVSPRVPQRRFYFGASSSSSSSSSDRRTGAALSGAGEPEAFGASSGRRRSLLSSGRPTSRVCFFR
ncbi:hypothetical protein B0G81_1711 [Paraburkholderia sp. BL6665CI2N2]|uniref:VOC family protein n=1 Tax=Paraburkholderia sp. BL6665CI2N2 TaxID=1938806 RepID=UPI0010EE5836|nr:hypothetical protein B0G81_1711 [Paraburkholderia sp. BL6665CI2N2]